MVHVDGEVGMVPVGQRVVEADLQPLGPERLDERLEQVLAVRRVGRLVVGRLAVPQTEPVMVLGRQHHIFHPCLTGPARPFLRVVEVGIEVLEVLLVARVVDFLAVLHPLVPGRERVDAPMDEHAEPVVLEPRLLLVGQKQFGRNLVTHRCILKPCGHRRPGVSSTPATAFKTRRTAPPAAGAWGGMCRAHLFRRNGGLHRARHLLCGKRRPRSSAG